MGSGWRAAIVSNGTIRSECGSIILSKEGGGGVVVEVEVTMCACGC